MGLSQALATAISGLRATQTGMSLVASNVANAQTPGYVRKTVTQVTTAASGAGLSVNVAAVTRELDQFVQRQLQVETSGAAYADLRAQFYERLQQVYGAPGSDISLETIFNNFTGSLQALSTNPADFSARASVLSSAQILAGQLNNVTGQIQALRTDAEQGLTDAVNTANNAMTQIANINLRLAASGAKDATAAALQDQRDVYITQLAQLMDIRVIEGDHNQITVFTASGIQLVGNEAAQLSFNEQGTVNAKALWDADPSKSGVGQLNLVLPTGGKYDLIANSALRSGQIAAFVEMRDRILVEAQTQIDGLAEAMAQSLSAKTVNGTAVTVGPQDGFDVDTANILEGDILRFTYTDVLTGKQHKVSVVRVEDASALPLSASVTADPDDEVIGLSFAGGTAGVVSQLNGLFNGKLQFSNTGSVIRVLDNGAVGTTAVNSASVRRTETSLTGGGPEVPLFTDANTPYSGAISATGSQRIGFAGRIAVNQSILADPTKLVVYQAGTSAGDPTRPNFLYDQLVNGTFDYSPSTGVGTAQAPFSGRIGSYLRQVLSQQGEAAKNADSIKQGQDVVLNSLQQRFNDASGVSVDQEMANLLNLQNAYGASARIMTTVRDMFQTLLQVIQ